MLQVPTPVDSKVLQYLITRCSLLLRAYATTMDRDQELLTEIKVKIKKELCRYKIFNPRLNPGLQCNKEQHPVEAL